MDHIEGVEFLPVPIIDARFVAYIRKVLHRAVCGGYQSSS